MNTMYLPGISGAHVGWGLLDLDCQDTTPSIGILEVILQLGMK